MHMCYPKPPTAFKTGTVCLMVQLGMAYRCQYQSYRTWGTTSEWSVRKELNKDTADHGISTLM